MIDVVSVIVIYFIIIKHTNIHLRKNVIGRTPILLHKLTLFAGVWEWQGQALQLAVFQKKNPSYTSWGMSQTLVCNTPIHTKV